VKKRRGGCFWVGLGRCFVVAGQTRNWGHAHTQHARTRARTARESERDLSLSFFFQGMGTFFFILAARGRKKARRRSAFAPRRRRRCFSGAGRHTQEQIPILVERHTQPPQPTHVPTPKEIIKCYSIDAHTTRTHSFPVSRSLSPAPVAPPIAARRSPPPTLLLLLFEPAGAPGSSSSPAKQTKTNTSLLTHGPHQETTNLVTFPTPKQTRHQTPPRGYFF
jgi:hypothetical protein